MIYLKKFENHTLYDSYINGGDAILPNVSICTTEEDVHYNPWVETKLVCKYIVTDTSNPIPLRANFEQNIFNSMEIDGVMLDELVTEYTFGTTGVHTVKYKLYDETQLGNSAPVFNSSNLIGCIIPVSVTSIGNYVFQDCSNLTSVTIPDSVTSIGSSAFQNCTGLTSVTIGNSVTSIGDYAFYTCSSLTSVDIPDSVTSIGDHVFDHCSGLTSITIGSGVTSISSSAFSGCSSLTSVTIGNSVTSIGSYAFYGCSGLTSIGPVGSGSDLEIPNSVTSIDTRAFYYCSGLTNVTIPDSVTSIGYDYLFSECTSLTSVTIGNGVTHIGYGDFSGCNSLTSITIGDSVTSIAGMAFYNCSSLTSIISNANTAPTIKNDTFRDVKTGGTLTVPSGSTGYDTWMGTGNYYLGKYNWTKVEQ